jgi:hypothetical protein
MQQGHLEAFSGGALATTVPLARAAGRNWRSKLSPVLYEVSIISSFVAPWLAGAVYVGVALMWLVPNRRIERTLRAQLDS